MSARRERAVFVAAALALAGGAAVAYWLMLARGPAGVASAPAPGPPAAAQPTRLSVDRAEGGAVLLRAGAEREPLRAGVELRPEDVLETLEGSRVELVAGGSYTVVLEGASRFAVQEIAAEVSRFRIEDGLVTATVREDPSRLVVVEAPGAQARTRGGALAVSSVAGIVAVGVSSGSAEFEAAGQIVTLQPGQGSVAKGGGPPAAPAPLPRSLLLKVDWPAGRKTNVRRLLVRGQATPGAVLTIGGQRVTVGPDGRFAQAVWLREGAQEIEAVARDVAGRREQRRSPVVILDTRAPDAEFDTRSIWKGSPSTDKPR